MSNDPYRRQRIFWFITMNLMAMVVAGGLFAWVLYGDSMNAFFEPLMNGIFEYKLVVVLIAMSPLLASLLVGMAYAQRALRRKKAQAAMGAAARPA